jgi:hypothetical protein
MPQSISDGESSTHSTNRITYQRPFRFQLNPSLSDLRSWRNRCFSDQSTGSSSVVPGIGYLSGNAIEWVGEKILSGIMAIESRRLIWSARRLINKMERVPENERIEWSTMRHNRLNRGLDSLLELSSYVLQFQ